MTEKKDAGSMLRKMVRFVANPTTDWSALNTGNGDTDSQTANREELRAMVERKRRNEFVRKREFDMLRRVRREGLSPEQAAAIDRASRLDENDARSSQPPGSGTRDGVKDKIDAIEQQMVGSGGRNAAARERPPPVDGDATVPMALLRDDKAADGATAAKDSNLLDAPELAAKPAATDKPPAELEVNEVVHDAELDEVVIAFANADFNAAEAALADLTGAGGVREGHLDTWLTRFDLYRATGQLPKFEALAVDFAHAFGQSAPQWISLPELVADAAQQQPRSAAGPAEIGWVSPPVLDADAVAQLESQTMQLPMPWVLDWRAIAKVQVDGASRLTELIKRWSTQELKMRWLAAEKLLQVLAEASPTGARDVDPSYWLVRMETLRLADRIDQFDEVAIDYCVTFEVSPPSWERSRCSVRFSTTAHSTRAAPMSIVGESVTSFMDSTHGDEESPATRHVVEVATLQLSGQLVGDIRTQLGEMDARIGHATVVRVACTTLIRADFIAAGDLLNWVIAKRNEGRHVTFADCHRLVANFFGAMGIIEHARVQTLQA
jgi:hypothetical protein